MEDSWNHKSAAKEKGALLRDIAPLRIILSLEGGIMINTYSTSQIAKIVGMHPNTVRMYEEWGLIQTPERKSNGYRVFTDIHIKQFELAKKAFQIEVLQSGLRKRMIDAVKLSARYRFDEAIELVNEYIEITAKEMENTKEAARLSKVLFQKAVNDGKYYKRAEAAKELGLTIDTIRNWEMNGLLTVKRKENGYRVYDTNDMNRLKVIRSLRCANYSLTAILRMLGKLEQYSNGNSEDIDILEILNTPDEQEDIVYVCDRLVDSLQNASENAVEVIEILQDLKNKYF